MSGFDVLAHLDWAKSEDAGQVVELRRPDGVLMTYKDASGADKPVTITVAGSYSTAYRNAANRQRDRIAKMRRIKASGKMLDEHALELAVACVLAWDGLEKDGKPYPCTPDNVRWLLNEYAWVRELVEEAMHDHEGFTRSSSQT